MNIKVRAIYPPEEYLAEREAYLFEQIPVPLLRVFYPELINYIENLFHTTPLEFDTMLQLPTSPTTVAQIDERHSI